MASTSKRTTSSPPHRRSRLMLQQQLGSLLGLDADSPDYGNDGIDEDHGSGNSETSDVLDHLLTITERDDLLEYLTLLLGLDGAAAASSAESRAVVEFVDDVWRYRNDDNDESDGAHDDGVAAIATAAPSSSWKEQWENDGSRRKEKEDEITDRLASLGLVDDKSQEVHHQRQERRKQQQEGRRQEQQQQQQRQQQQEDKSGKKLIVQTQSKKNKNIRKEVEEVPSATEGGADGNDGATSRPSNPSRNSKNKSTKSGPSEPSTTNGTTTKSQNHPHQPASAKPIRGTPRIVCGCFGMKHKPLTNCLRCGRIVCAREGHHGDNDDDSDCTYCAHCGYRIDDEVIVAISSAAKGNDKDKELVRKALLHKERLLKFDREFAQRTVILDDQADYFGGGGNTGAAAAASESVWLDAEERADAEEREVERRRNLHERKKQVLDIDL